MVTRTVEVDDTLDEIIDSVKDDLKDMVISYLDDNPDSDEAPELFNDIDYDGSFHELVDGAVPIYTGEINDLWFLYGDEFEQAFDDAGIGDKNDEDFPLGWKAAAIYCYIQQEVAGWYDENADEIYENWKINNLIEYITNWDKEDVSELKDALDELYDYNTDMATEIAYELPSYPIPDDIREFCDIWAVDKDGYCLTGHNMDEIWHVDKIKEAKRRLDERG